MKTSHKEKQLIDGNLPETVIKKAKVSTSAFIFYISAC